VSVAAGFREALESVSGTVGDVIIIAVVLSVIGFLLSIVTDVKNLLNTLTGGGGAQIAQGAGYGNLPTVGLTTTGGVAAPSSIPLTGFFPQGLGIGTTSIVGSNPTSGGGLTATGLTTGSPWGGGLKIR